MNVTRFIFNDIERLSNFACPRKDSVFASSITRTWKEEKLTEHLIRRECRLAREEEIRASKGVFFGGIFGAMLWCVIGIGVYILF